jgi:membrane protein YqaA with SNARE-associated domain
MRRLAGLPAQSFLTTAAKPCLISNLNNPQLPPITQEAGILDIIDIVRVFTHNPFFLQYGLAGLFLNGLLSSVVPIPTELTATALLAGGTEKLWVFIALSSGSIIGGFLAYYLGRTGKLIFGRLHKKPNKQDEEKSQGLLMKYGWIAIFFCSWVPILGDVIPIVAGAKKYDFWKFAFAMASGKAIKVVAIVYISSFFATTFLH